MCKENYELNKCGVIKMLETIVNTMNENQLHFAVKNLSINSVEEMLESDGWVSED
ncbi:hypothetical protein GCM10008918_10860 [Lactobacillus kefiranofaciens subsp. kefiranofaciens]|uniref:Uncharacterized protein n=1 Tax=Lactobacillus kefiranofaciens TaxID=267818 RepID=A0ABY0MDX0_9LACO|nr:hypothetical protein SAMN02983011_01191 [Lactobacillus kefiranofaciens]